MQEAVDEKAARREARKRELVERARIRGEKKRAAWDEPDRWASAALAGAWSTRHEPQPESVKRANDRLEEQRLPLRAQGKAGYLPNLVERANRVRFKLPLIERLHDQGKLEVQHVQSAEEIRAIAELAKRALSVKAVDITEMRCGGGVSEPAPLSLIAARYKRTVYEPWVADLQDDAPRMRSGRRIRAAAAVAVEAVLVGPSLRSMEGKHKLRNGSAVEVIRACLDRWPLQLDSVLTPDLAEFSEKMRGG